MDKPVGPTSHDVVARARRLFGTRAVGHTGTLDPFATGLLVLVFGGATRLARWGEQQRKTYLASVRLGVTTATDDLSGEVTETRDPAEWPDLAAVERALKGLLGRQQQEPPAYSAKKVAGERSYRLARAGAGPRPAAVAVEVFGLELIRYAPPLVELRAVVSPGTYLRALGRDLGTALGTGAHLTGLRREWIGRWSVAAAVPLAELTGREPLLPARELVGELAGIELSAEEVVAVRHGRDVARPAPTEGEAALLAGGRLVAVARAAANGWHPAVVLPADEGSGTA